MDRGRAAGACAQRRRALRLHALGNVQAQVVSVRQALTARVAVVADAAAANDDDDGVELRSALGVRCCEGSPLFPECVLPMRCARMLPVCAGASST